MCTLRCCSSGGWCYKIRCKTQAQELERGRKGQARERLELILAREIMPHGRVPLEIWEILAYSFHTCEEIDWKWLCWKIHSPRVWISKSAANFCHHFLKDLLSTCKETDSGGTHVLFLAFGTSSGLVVAIIPTVLQITTFKQRNSWKSKDGNLTSVPTKGG